MATDISYASSDSNLESLILHTLPDFGEHGDGILNSNMLTAILKEKGSFEEVEGGLEFWYGIDKAESSNFKWQGKNDDMTANAQDPYARLRYDPKVFTGSVVKNALEMAQNKGRAAIKDWLKSSREHAIKTIKNQFNSAWWTASPAADAPNSIPSLVSATPTTGTIGGIAVMERLRITQAVGTSTPDIIIMDQIRFAGLVGYLATLMRWQPNDKLAQLKIPSIQLGDATIGYENLSVLGGADTITSGYMYLLNSEFLKIKRLLDENRDGWAKEFERVGRSLNKAVYYNWFGNLVTNTPRAHCVATSVAST